MALWWVRADTWCSPIGRARGSRAHPKIEERPRVQPVPIANDVANVTRAADLQLSYYSLNQMAGWTQGTHIVYGTSHHTCVFVLVQFLIFEKRLAAAKTQSQIISIRRSQSLSHSVTQIR